MPSRKLLGAWAFVDTWLLAAGILSLVMSLVWRAPDVLENLVISGTYLNAGLGLGATLLATWAISVGAIIQPNHVTVGLVILCWMLILDSIFILVFGTSIWFFTLRERANFHDILAAQSNNTIIAVQDKLQCCGYFNSSDLAVPGGSFCQNQTFIETTNNATGNFCVGPLTSFADMTLNNIFSTIYGFMAITILLFLASLCVVKTRKEEERFKKIDEKRGGRGFV